MEQEEDVLRRSFSTTEAAVASGNGSLKEAMRQVLETKGVIDHVKAELRAAVFHSLREANSQEEGVESARPPVPPENLLLNELIKDYLAFNGMEHSLSVFKAESGSGKESTSTTLPRAILASQLGLTGAPVSVPLLYAMLHELRTCGLLPEGRMNVEKILDVVLNMRLAARELKKCADVSDKASEREKRKAKKALENDNDEAAHAYAEGTIRKKCEGASYHRLAARVDAAAERIQNAVFTSALTNTLERTVCGMGKVLQTLDPAQVTKAMDALERQLESVAAQASLTDGTFEGVRTLTVPVAEVESLLREMAGDKSVERGEQMDVAAMFFKKSPAAASVGDDAGTQEQPHRFSMGAG